MPQKYLMVISALVLFLLYQKASAVGGAGPVCPPALCAVNPSAPCCSGSTPAPPPAPVWKSGSAPPGSASGSGAGGGSVTNTSSSGGSTAACPPQTVSGGSCLTALYGTKNYNGLCSDNTVKSNIPGCKGH